MDKKRKMVSVCLENATAFDRATPNIRGNLHERMQFTLKMFGEIRSRVRPISEWPDLKEKEKLVSIDTEHFHVFCNAMLYLMTEVSFYEPVNPPAGRSL